jgi:transcriptional antiterminator RfaH
MNWLVASYKINELKKLEINLKNQQLNYYIPKIFTKKLNRNPTEEILFPGYVFINDGFENYTKINFTKGIKNVIKFGDHIPYLNEEEVKSIKSVEKISKSSPIVLSLNIGQKVVIEKGSFMGSVVEICSLPKNNRIEILIYILGCNRKVNIAKKDLAL